MGAPLASPVTLRRSAQLLDWGDKLNRRLIAALGATGLLLTALPTLGRGQSLTGARITGAVRDDEGLSLAGVRVVLEGMRTGLMREAVTDDEGRFAYPIVPAGEYRLLAEQLGYRPKRVVGLDLRPGAVVVLVLELTAVPPPVSRIDTVRYQGSGLEVSRAGSSQWFSALAVSRLPGERRELADLGRLAPSATPGLEIEGLPRRLAGYAADGVGFAPARHPVLDAGGFSTIAFPLSGLAGAELLTNPVDVEWSEASGGILSGHQASGADRFSLQAFGDWSGDALAWSDYFDADRVSFSTVRGGLLASGPVIADSAHFALGGEIRRVENPQPRAWTPSALDTALLAEADAGFGVDLEDHLRSRVVSNEVVSAFARYAWQVTPTHHIGVRSNFAHLDVGNFDPGVGFAPSLASGLDGVDFSAGATLTSQFTTSVVQEFRVGVESSERTFGASILPATTIVAGGQRFGSDPALPGDFKRTAVQASETLHLSLGSHLFKLGVGVTTASHDQTYSHAQRGEFFFSSVDGFLATEGVFVQSVGPLPSSSFSTFQFAGYVQDMWQAAPGFRLTWGLRYELERLPTDEVLLNEDWVERSGLSNTSVDRSRSKWSPRGGFEFRRNDWIVRGSGGIYYGVVDPGVFAELVTHNGRVRVRRGVGVLGAWPGTPDSTAAPVVGPRLTLFGPQFEAPRSSRVSVGISRSMGPEAAVHLSGVYRHTDFLPRRRNLNRLTSPANVDQYGRPVYGQLVQQDQLLAAAPGSNRRFAEFDLVSALNADGFSDFWAGTMLIERHLGEVIRFSAAYTYSRTTDNWLVADRRGGGPDDELNPFPDGLSGRDWSNDRSDFDIPHRVAVGVELTTPGRLDVSLAGFYRFQSGAPFTPGFRDGVDANGDGSARNDPAFVDDEVPGIADLVSQWACLRKQLGQFAGRNSCRSPGIHTLDVGVRVGLVRLAGFWSELRIDALNLLEADLEYPDRALFFVDPNGAVTTDPVTGVVSVPLVVNPAFGEPLSHRTSGRMLRLGLRAGF